MLNVGPVRIEGAALIEKILASVLAPLMAAGIFALLRSRWLFVFIPKLYLNTPISDGQIVSLTIQNKGFLSEEDVAVTFRPSCKFEIIATSKSTLSISGKTITIPKLARGESVTVHVLFEERSFSISDVESVESKATRGKVTERKEDLVTPFQSVLAFVLFALFFTVPFVVGTIIGADMKVSIVKYAVDRLSTLGPLVELSKFEETNKKTYGNGHLENAFDRSQIAVDVIKVVRSGDTLNISMRIENKTAFSMSVEGNVSASGGDGPYNLSDRFIETEGLVPGSMKIINYRVFLPETLDYKVVKTALRFESINRGAVNVDNFLEFK